MSTVYNGWANYETWCVNLWLANDQGDHNYWTEQASQCIAAVADGQGNEFASDDKQRERIMLADLLKSQLDDNADEYQQLPESGMYADLLNAALNAVDWYEVAEAFLDAAREQQS